MEQSENHDANNIGTDIATIYYNYGNGLSGIYVINAIGTVKNSEKVELVFEAIDIIHNIQNSYNAPSIEPLAASSKKTLVNLQLHQLFCLRENYR